MSVVTELPKPKTASREEVLETLRDYIDLAKNERVEFLEVVARVAGQDEDQHSIVIDGVYSSKG
jgi:hypothetical protein